jgi:hypothetical protein
VVEQISRPYPDLLLSRAIEGRRSTGARVCSGQRPPKPMSSIAIELWTTRTASDQRSFGAVPAAGSRCLSPLAHSIHEHSPSHHHRPRPRQPAICAQPLHRARSREYRRRQPSSRHGPSRRRHRRSHRSRDSNSRPTLTARSLGGPSTRCNTAGAGHTTPTARSARGGTTHRRP